MNRAAKNLEGASSNGPSAKVPTLVQKVFDDILAMIYSGELKPGAVLNEVVIAERFNVSRGPVREAISRLQGVQLVTREPFVKARVVRLDRAAFLDLFEIRASLEGCAARLAAERLSNDELFTLAGQLETSRRAYMMEGRPQNDFDFHERIARASRNPRLVAMLCGDLYHLLRMARRLAGDVAVRKQEAYHEHWNIIQAIKARDPDLAERRMREHITKAATHIAMTLPETNMPDVMLFDEGAA
jgi:DNA-binding GntR family transcriptional regulator